ncbi:MAG TPA: hypothetical protein VF803_01965 [Candidatus Paceibacterota bacterium]
MDTLQISGKWYISTARAAKEHGYHTDYVGQLIRSGQVKGQKVGRSWYVLAESLTDYLEHNKNAKPVRKARSKAREAMKSEDGGVARASKEKAIDQSAQKAAEVVNTAIAQQDAPRKIEEPTIKATPVVVASTPKPQEKPVMRTNMSDSVGLMTYLQDDGHNDDITKQYIGQSAIQKERDPDDGQPIMLRKSVDVVQDTVQASAKPFDQSVLQQTAPSIRTIQQTQRAQPVFGAEKAAFVGMQRSYVGNSRNSEVLERSIQPRRSASVWRFVIVAIAGLALFVLGGNIGSWF